MILIIGANGQLGKDFQALFTALNTPFIATHHSAANDCEILDVTNLSEIELMIKQRNIQMIINCAAFNDVDRSEVEPKLAYQINAIALKQLAQVSKAYDVVLVTYSTNFVFNGLKRFPYTEADITSPVNIYGRSKLQGEQDVLQTCWHSFVIRTSWVFGLGNHNFAKAVINWSKRYNELKIVNDQISSPTYTKDLAKFSWSLIQSKKYGLYHLSNQGEASKYDQAKYILSHIGWQGTLHPVESEHFITAAKRAKYTKLDSSAAERIVGRKMPHWQDAIDRFLEEMRQAGEL